MDDFEHSLQVARAEKAHVHGKTEDILIEKAELEDEERSLLKEISDIEGTIARDADMIGTLDTEIEKLEAETTEKLQ